MFSACLDCFFEAEQLALQPKSLFFVLSDDGVRFFNIYLFIFGGRAGTVDPNLKKMLGA